MKPSFGETDLFTKYNTKDTGKRMVEGRNKSFTTTTPTRDMKPRPAQTKKRELIATRRR
jgi:hypothetical protein